MAQVVKSPDAFRTISEVAQVLDLEPHVLRFWETKFDQVNPVKRSGGRRYYRAEDVALLGGIKFLLRVEGMTIKGAQRLLREKGVRHVAGLAPEGVTTGIDGDEGPEGADVVLLDGRRPKAPRPALDTEAAPPVSEPSPRGLPGGDVPLDPLAAMVAEATRANRQGVSAQGNAGETGAAQASGPAADSVDGQAETSDVSAGADDVLEDGPGLSPERPAGPPIDLPDALVRDTPDDARLRLPPRRPRIDPDHARGNRGVVRRHLASLRDIRARMDRYPLAQDA